MSEIALENERVPRGNGIYVREYLPDDEIPERIAALKALGWTFSRWWKSRDGHAWFEMWRPGGADE